MYKEKTNWLSQMSVDVLEPLNLVSPADNIPVSVCVYIDTI